MKSQERSGDADQTVDRPAQTARPPSAPSSSAARRSRAGAGRAPTSAAHAETAARSSASPPIQTIVASLKPPLKNRAQKQTAAAADAEPAVRTGADASIAESPGNAGSQTAYIGSTAGSPP